MQNKQRTQTHVRTQTHTHTNRVQNDRLLFYFDPILIQFDWNESSSRLIKLRRVDERDSQRVSVCIKNVTIQNL